jgi:hypothetical protein
MPLTATVPLQERVDGLPWCGRALGRARRVALHRRQLRVPVRQHEPPRQALRRRGPSRFAYHGVTKIRPNTANAATGLAHGRLNLTLRETGLS